MLEAAGAAQVESLHQAQAMANSGGKTRRRLGSRELVPRDRQEAGLRGPRHKGDGRRARPRPDIAAMTRCRSAAEKFGAISYGMTPHSQYTTHADQER